MDDVSQLKEYLGDYLRQKGIRIDRAFSCLAPDHPDVHPSMVYNRKRQNVHCFSCGVTYDLFDLIGMDYGVSSFPEQLQKARELFGGAHFLAVSETKCKKKEEDTLCHKEFLRLWEQRQDGEYFASRGISPQMQEQYRLFEYDGRAYFPLFFQRSCIGWCARATNDQTQPRYLNSKGPMGLFNGDYLTEEGGCQTIYITEGVINAITLEQMGKKAIALCGSQNANKLFELCRQFPAASRTRTMVACGDGDEAGKRMNQSLTEGLKALGIPCSVLPMEGERRDLNDLYLQDRDRLAAMLQREQEQREQSQSQQDTQTQAEKSLNWFFDQCQSDCAMKPVSTGWRAIDRHLDGGLYPGLYVLGAVSSAGKTSFLLQMADEICKGGRDVLFFSLEQSKKELIAKSLSRLSYQLDRHSPITVHQLVTGEIPPWDRRLEAVKEAYLDRICSVYFYEGVADIGVLEIREAVARHLAQGRKPVVMVDYLQILKPSDVHSTDKQNTDRAVVELKRISRDFDLPLVAVSSFNRDNYRSCASMESFKESGAVEYSSDVLMGLQLKGVGEKQFDINTAKLKEPREMEWVLLKNRNGIPYAKVSFDYVAKYHCFSQKEPSMRRPILTVR